MIKFLHSLEDRFFALCKATTWLNIKSDYLVQQAVIHALINWALAVSLGQINKWLLVPVFFFPLFKELIFDGHYTNWKTEGPEMRKDFWTDILTNYIGFVIGAAIILLS